MTNKTREKLQDKLNFSFDEGYGQGRLAILRKWKKAMEKGYTQVEEFTGLKSDFIDFGTMQEEYLKAKGNTVKNNI